MNWGYFYFLLFIFFSCDFTTGKNNFNPDASFYKSWNENTKFEIQSCCTDEELKPYLEDDVKRMFRSRAMLFESLMKELPQEKNYSVEESYSEGNEFCIHQMIVSTSEYGKRASMNYKEEIEIDTAKLKLLPFIQTNFSKSCCPFTREEFEIFDGYIPLKCITLINLNKVPIEFKIQLSIK
ncbi:MAG: hypothetical protein H6567_08130 [Lewinellaceae bacterium]|nr:hypothetical protein [Lewinellaceae bacterium]